MNLTSKTKEDIHKAFQVMGGSGVPEDQLLTMMSRHAIGLLENQRPEWFTADAPVTLPHDPALQRLLALIKVDRAALAKDDRINLVYALIGELQTLLEDDL